MKTGRVAFCLFLLCLIAWSASSLAGFQSSGITPGSRICVVALRFSRLFTLRIPESAQVKAKTRATPGLYEVYRPGNNQVYILPTVGCHWHVAFPGRPPILIPVPADSMQDCEEQNPLRPTLEGTAPDRTQPDVKIKNRIEREFLRQKQYLMVDSPDQADYVFLVEAHYDKEMFGQFAYAPTQDPTTLAEGEHLESALAILVPSAVYRQHRSEGAALLAARLWDGEILGQYGISYRALSPDCVAQIGCNLGGVDRNIPGTVVDPVAEDLVKKFHGTYKGPKFQVSLCVAAPLPSSHTTRQPVEKSKPVLLTGEKGSLGSESKQTQASDDEKAIKVDVTLVTVPLTVTDIKGQYLTNLKVSDFRVYENSVVQTIDRLIPTADPVNVALVLADQPISGFSYQDLQNSAIKFVESLRPEDRVMVVSFDDKIHIESEFTNDREKLRRAILQIEPGCCSRLYDAVDLVMSERLSQVPGRKAMVLFAPSLDACSRLVSAGETLSRVEESGVPIYAVQYALPPRRNAGRGASSAKFLPPADYLEEFLQKLSIDSGGQPSKAGSLLDVDRSFAQIASQLQNQYALCYYPSDRAVNKQFRRVSISVDRPGAKVHAPAGYRAKF